MSVQTKNVIKPIKEIILPYVIIIIMLLVIPPDSGMILNIIFGVAFGVTFMYGFIGVITFLFIGYD